MIVAKNLEELSGSIGAACATIGNFDGVHMGHRRLITRVNDRARAKNMIGLVVTFDPHPLTVVGSGKRPPFITTVKRKLELIESLGSHLTVVLPFDKKLAALEPEDFVREYLVQGLRVKELVIGYDYAFGKGRKGNFDMLRALGDQYGLRVEQLDPVIIDGAVVSSTRIRDMIRAGDVWNVKPLLGRFHELEGTVVHGHSRGKKLGFPTANLQPDVDLLPKTGVYAVWASLQGGLVPGVANVGLNPTFGDNALSVEAHLFDFSSDLYGQHLRIHLVQRLRPERKFDNIEALVSRIREDAALARDVLSSAEAELN
ncbi:MAG: bifunctional riboflavin kinase/FAD synthetase [Desulfovibrionaceae bacterium]|nr:bifunctional riboflavin kinase/FAD synthetase [Desulfovibrionaceae bacterium]MBF0514528.1 bifunctional riboflavin kinase/FAD synthetase [Desulfovibrionaceae bacterium]